MESYCLYYVHNQVLFVAAETAESAYRLYLFLHLPLPVKSPRGSRETVPVSPHFNKSLISSFLDFSGRQMHEPRLSLKTGAATVNIDQHPVQVDGATESLRIREINTNQDHDAFSPHLPPELISHIFTIYTENFNSSFDIHRPSAERGPLLLGAVSKLWREVAFGTPQLWNTITIQFYIQAWPLDKIKMKIELVKQWLDRSRQLPLHISFRAEEMSMWHAKDLWGPIFSLIRNCAPRWHTLVLDICLLLYAAFLDGLTYAPRLHTLKLGYMVDSPFDNDSSHDPFHLQTPSLKHLAIIDLPLSSIAVEWGNITHFEGNNLHVDEFFETLRLARRLTSCKLHRLRNNLHRYPLPTIPLIHSALKRLRLPSVRSLEHFIDLLVFPSLEKFRYKCEGIHSLLPKSCLISLFNRSRCQLTHFGLLSGELLEDDMDDLISLFFALPTLTHLKFEDLKFRCYENRGIMTDRLLQKLMPIEGIQAGLLPCLQSLKFCGKQKFLWNCLADFIVARLTEDNNGSNSPIADKMAVNRNLPVFRHSIRFISFIVRGCTQAIDLDTRAQFNRARGAGVSIEIVDELLHRAL